MTHSYAPHELATLELWAYAWAESYYPAMPADALRAAAWCAAARALMGGPEADEWAEVVRVYARELGQLPP